MWVDAVITVFQALKTHVSEVITGEEGQPYATQILGRHRRQWTALGPTWGLMSREWYRPAANTGHSPDAVSMLDQRRRRWTNIETALGECPVFSGAA